MHDLESGGVQAAGRVRSGARASRLSAREIGRELLLARSSSQPPKMSGWDGAHSLYLCLLHQCISNAYFRFSQRELFSTPTRTQPSTMMKSA